MKTCKHDPFVPRNTLVIEAHWAAGVRVRCTECGETAHVSKKGRVKPDGSTPSVPPSVVTQPGEPA